MQPFDVISILLVLTALFSYLNRLYIKLPTKIGVMLISLVVSVLMLAMSYSGLLQDPTIYRLVASVNFSRVLLGIMLAFLLFAAAIHINAEDILNEKFNIAVLALSGVAVSTLVTAALTFYILRWTGIHLDFLYCLLFGALISPTDPIAVTGIIAKAGAPRSLTVKIAGESLFNDGIAVVLFMEILGLINGANQFSLSGIAVFFAREAMGGVLFGAALGMAGYALLKSIDDYQVELLITLALVSGGYSLAGWLETSGPIAIVIAGLLIGNYGRNFAMSKKTRDNLDTFWELVDEVMNALLFVLIGLEIIVLPISKKNLMAGATAIPIVLFARFVSMAIPVTLIRTVKKLSPHAVRILTWAGLHGAISVAMALSLPLSHERSIILNMTYSTVVFSILVQGLTVQKFIKRALKEKQRQ